MSAGPRRPRRRPDPRVRRTGSSRRASDRMSRRSAIVAALATTIAAAAPDQRVELRSGELIHGRIVAIDSGGVSIARAVDRPGARGSAGTGEAVERVGWDRVARLEGEGLGPDAERWLAEGERLWRARLRLARGDAMLAAKALETHALVLEGDGPTSIVRALIGLQLALARSDAAAALESALEAMRLRRRGVDDPTLAEWVQPSRSGALARRTLFDDATGLSPLVAPFAASEPERREMLAVLDRFDPRGDLALDELRREFAAVLDPSRGGGDPPGERAGSRSSDRSVDRGGSGSRADDDGARVRHFMRALRDAQSTDAAERRRGREALSTLRRRMPEWAEAWARMAAGRGLLLDDTPEARLAAQLELVHLPARFADAQPRLASLAASLAAKVSLADGRAEEAHRLSPDASDDSSNSSGEASSSTSDGAPAAPPNGTEPR